MLKKVGVIGALGCLLLGVFTPVSAQAKGRSFEFSHKTSGDYVYSKKYITSHKYKINKKLKTYKGMGFKIKDVTVFHTTGKYKTYLRIRYSARNPSNKWWLTALPEFENKRFPWVPKKDKFTLAGTVRKKYPQFNWTRVGTISTIGSYAYEAYPTITPHRNNFKWYSNYDQKNDSIIPNAILAQKKWYPSQFFMVSKHNYGKTSRVGKIKISFLQGLLRDGRGDYQTPPTHLKPTSIKLNLNKNAK